ncbi:uncharacterized protein BP5553_06844 [Venustampulla echinocandica]|uniref:Galactose oxidase n=1 Tax=Venustampulla echinocandica TaxID=2656787 RepID=A0A370TL28_9HELO|nr:uncharacterized protein BP5553_06844 [Venustampulla echinocandica]RDL36232.1 hypothetical protein BP5553_06844 [Venustampulla echinocandica]
MRHHVTALLWALAPSLFAAVLSLSTSLPYNPTSIYLSQLSSTAGDLAYAFVPNPESNSRYELLLLNISSTLWTTNLSVDSTTTSLPFTVDQGQAFTPSISSLDEISVYTGSCSTPSTAQLWQFTPSNMSANGNGTWAQQSTSTTKDATYTGLMGPNFLSAALSFSAFVNANASQSNIYIFGGMCPESDATASTWQSAANYSSSMLRFVPSTPSADTGYSLARALSKGPPIAEAGFTITGLAPSYSNKSGVVTQQQSSVLIGGHTQRAFLNMSQVALWNLPEESWSFITVGQQAPPPGPNTELAIKSMATSIDSRSGHTAVLTEDGSRIIVFGGWVGDISQAAEPQLVVLHVGTGFGGDNDWEWSIPGAQPSGLGTYGHGAVMLPGNVMMVLGGYEISNSTTSKREVSSTNAMFFNTTSMEWGTMYTNPAYLKAISKPPSSSGSSKSKAKKIGLGAGLGLGFAAIIIAVVVYFCYSRRLKKKREDEREKDLRSLNNRPANQYPSGPMRQTGGGFPWSNGRWNGNDDQERQLYDSAGAPEGYENLYTGVHGLGDSGSNPTSRQIPRKPLHSRARGIYQPAPAFDFTNGGSHGRANSLGTAGPIHPIYEADEDDHVGYSNVDTVGMALGHPSTAGPADPKRLSDPFRDTTPSPTRDNRGEGPYDQESPAHSRDREIQEWVSDWAAADALLNAQARSHSSAGRISPTRRAQLVAGTTVSSLSADDDGGRTGSNLSEGSFAVSAISRSGSSSHGRSRSNSLRGFITSTINPFTSSVLSPTEASTTMSPMFDSRPHSSKSNQPPPRSAGSGTSSFTTAHTSFTALQAEAEGLLLRPGELSPSGDNSPTRSQPEQPGSPSKSKAPGGRQGRGQGSWLGSLRRVFVGDSTSEDVSPDYHTPPSREPSPTRMDHGSGAAPRRTVSAGATMWRRKQGKGDWEDSAEGDSATRSNTFTGDYPREDESLPGKGKAPQEEEDEWDIERAVQNRVVQVMFTVPKEKLRVVNHDVLEDKSEVGSLKSKSGSAKSAKDDAAAAQPSIAAITEAASKSAGPSMETISETSSNSGRAKSKVLEMVEKMEGRSSPDRSF